MNARRLIALSFVVAVPAAAQDVLLPSAGWGLGTTISAWYFATPISQSGGDIQAVAQVAVPFRVRAALGTWSIDLTGAGAYGAAALKSSSSSSSASSDGGDDTRVVTVGGATDVKLRLTGPFLLDRTQLTVGINAPTGKTGLSADETTALRNLAAPALHMPVGAFGAGTGFTLGLVRAFEGEDWAVAVGGSVEQRTEYSPIALALTSGKVETKVTPGTALHATAGLDRGMGEGRFSLLVTGDLFSKDKVRVTGGGADDYTLGPQFTATSRFDLAASGWRESTIDLGVRLRSQYSDSSGTSVAGSGGTYVEGSIGGIRGGPLGTGFIIGGNARWHSGLTFTDALVGAATTAAGVSLGFEKSTAASATRFVVHAEYGTFDTGKTSTAGYNFTMGLSVTPRRPVR
jgi:hypothetical protein